jgi:hypothetical protein
MAGIKIVDLPALGRDLINTDLLEVSLNGSGSRKITGQEIMNASKLAVGSTPIVSGTVGRLLFQNTGDVLGQSGSLFWDNTNGRLGIGTNAPSGRIHVKGSVASEIFKAESTIAALYAQFVSTDGAGEFGIYTDAFYFQPLPSLANGTRFLNGANAIIMQLAQTGNVLINTTTDAGFRLDVNGTARVSGLTTLSDGLRINGGWTTFNASTIFGSSAQSGNTFNFATQYIGGATGTTNYFNFSGTLTSQTGGSFNVFNVQQTFSNTNSAQTFRGFYYNPNITGLQAGTTHRAIETTSGDVLFGTTSGSVVVAASAVTNMQYGEVPKLYVNGGTYLNGTIQLGSSNIRVNGNNISWESTGITNNLPEWRADAAGIKFGNYSSLPLRISIGASENARFFSTGNVAIGTTTDAGFKLDVNGTARVTGTFSLGADTARIDLWRSSGTGGGRIGTGYTNPSVNHVYITCDVNSRAIVIDDSNRTVFSSSLGDSTVASAQVTINSSTRGFLPPRMTNAQRAAIASPAVGLIVYCTDSTEGLYVYKSTGWTFMV